MLQTRVIQAEATVKTAEAASKAQYRKAEEQAAAAVEAARREAEMQRQMTQTEVARREAERKVIEAQAAAQAERMKGLTEAEIMAAKGYSQKDVLQSKVQKAYAEGIGNMGSGVSIGGGRYHGPRRWNGRDGRDCPSDRKHDERAKSQFAADRSRRAEHSCSF